MPVGLSLKPVHYHAILTEKPRVVDFWEIHPENYMANGGHSHRWLEEIRAHYPLSFHSVGLSLGSSTPPDAEHLKALRALADRYTPFLFSDHLSWSRAPHGIFLPDLLPLPYTEETLATVCRHIDQVQEAMGRRMALENPSTYLQVANDFCAEADFLNALSDQTGCGLLLDINNIIVSAHNHGGDAGAYLRRLKRDAVHEIHLAGHTVHTAPDGTTWRLDDHGSAVNHEGWTLYQEALSLLESPLSLPVVVEWDTRVPAFPILKHEAERAAALAARAAREIS
jgi:uncharacterized protein